MKNDINYEDPESDLVSPSEYLQILRKYRDEIKQGVLLHNNLCKDSMKKCSSQVIISRPDICDSSIPNNEASDNAENVIKIYVYNVNGNSNELRLVPGEASISEGSLKDIPLSEEISDRIAQALNNINERQPGSEFVIKIPVFIININNVLSNGNKNAVTLK